MAYKPYLPVEYEKKHVAALQALERGEATEHQQQIALKYIVNNIAKTYDMHWFPDARETDFASGKAYVGHQIAKLLKLNVSAIKEKE